jgi:hypothetical protein
VLIFESNLNSHGLFCIFRKAQLISNMLASQKSKHDSSDIASAAAIASMDPSEKQDFESDSDDDDAAATDPSSVS